MPIFKKEGNQLVEYTQPSQITESLKPQGNIVFANLPITPSLGDMYKVTDDFTTDNRFEEPNKEVKAPIFIYFNGTKWVLFASSGGDTHIIGTRNQCISWARQGMIPDGSVCIFTDDYATSTPYVVGTQAQINAMLSQGLLGDGTVVIITDDYTEELNLAENIGYDNTTSGLSADDVQGAIDEVDSNLNGLHIITTTIQFASNAGTINVDLSNILPDKAHAFVIGATVINKANGSRYQISTGSTIGTNVDATVYMINHTLRSYITSNSLSALGGQTVNVVIGYIV